MEEAEKLLRQWLEWLSLGQPAHMAPAGMTRLWLAKNHPSNTDVAAFPLTRMSIPGNVCVHCGTEIGQSMVCSGCDWCDPMTMTRESWENLHGQA